MNFAVLIGRVFTEQEVLRRRRVAVIGYGPYEALFAARGIDPIGKHCGSAASTIRSSA